MLRARQPGIAALYAPSAVLINVPAATITIQAYAPQVTIIGKPIQGLTLLFGELYTPAAGVSVNVPAPAIALSASVPVISAGKSVAVPVATIAISAPAPTVASGKSAQVPASTIAITAPAPTIQAATGPSIVVPATAIALTAFAPSIQTSPPIVIIDDTHDGDYLGKKLRKERKAVAARRQRVLDLYEQIVEGKQPEPEVVALVEAAGINSPDSIIYAPAIELTGLIATLERAQQLAERLAIEAAIEADDEEVLLLL